MDRGRNLFGKLALGSALALSVSACAVPVTTGYYRYPAPAYSYSYYPDYYWGYDPYWPDTGVYGGWSRWGSGYRGWNGSGYAAARVGGQLAVGGHFAGGGHSHGGGGHSGGRQNGHH